MLDARCWHPQRGLPVDDPRWREPVADVAPMPTERMGPPPGASPPMRMTASWLGSKRTCRIQVWWREAAPQWRAPLGLIPPDKRCPTPQLKKPVSGHHPSACSGVKALRKHKRPKNHLTEKPPYKSATNCTGVGPAAIHAPHWNAHPLKSRSSWPRRAAYRRCIRAWTERGLPGRLLPVDAADHFTILDALARPEGVLTRALLAMLGR